MKEEIIKIENIKPGDRFKNYKEFCKALEITPKTSSSKEAQLKRISRYLKFHTYGREHIIDEVYEKPLAFTETATDILTKKKKKGRPKANPTFDFSKYIKFVLMNYLIYKSKTPGEIYLSKISIYKMLGLVNRNFNEDICEIQFLNKHEDINSTQVNYVKNQAMVKAGELLRYVLETLRDQKLIRYKDVIILIPLDGEKYEADSDEERIVLEEQRNTLIEMGFSNSSEVFKANKHKEYYERLNQKLEKYGWKQSYSLIKIIFNKNHIFKELEETEQQLMKEELNINITGFLENKMKRDYYQNRVEETMEVAKKIWDEKPENALKRLPFEECMEKFKTISDEFIKYISTPDGSK